MKKIKLNRDSKEGKIFFHVILNLFQDLLDKHRKKLLSLGHFFNLQSGKTLNQVQGDMCCVTVDRYTNPSQGCIY